MDVNNELDALYLSSYILDILLILYLTPKPEAAGKHGPSFVQLYGTGVRVDPGFRARAPATVQVENFASQSLIRALYASVLAACLDPGK